MTTVKVSDAHLTQGPLYAEVRMAIWKDRVISDAAAATIASWWQAGSNPALTRLASGMPVRTEDVVRDAAQELDIDPVSMRPTGLDATALRKLIQWAERR